MNMARIAELLEPFLRAPIAPPGISAASESNLSPASDLSHSDALGHSEIPQLCHSEPAQAGEESPVLSPAQLHDISTYIDILIRWNARINLTAVRDPEEIVTRHFGESLFTACHLFPTSVHAGAAAPQLFPSGVHVGTAAQACPERSRRGCPAERSSAALTTVADLGSGAGFPGLPIKLWAPQISLTLIESNHKKATFLREVTRALTLTDVNIQNARAETLTGKAFDVITLRAVERFESILPAAAALVRPAGRLALLIGASQQTQAQTSLPQFTWFKPIPIPCSTVRILLTGKQQVPSM
jgi:16S rRNA (guanine527-N7)-methyltransferase